MISEATEKDWDDFWKSEDISFKEIWESEQRQNCLKKINLSKCPVGCKLDPLNKTLWDTFENTKNYDNHTNFV